MCPLLPGEASPAPRPHIRFVRRHWIKCRLFLPFGELPSTFHKDYFFLFPLKELTLSCPSLLITQVPHIQLLGYWTFQSSFFLFFSRIFFVIGAVHAQGGTMQPSHSYVLTSFIFPRAYPFNGVGTSVQHFLSHAGSRHALQVLHAARVHGGW